MKRVLMIVVLLSTALAHGLRAETAPTPESLFSAGNSAYEAGAYADAIDRYQAVAREGVADADLYYNLGNAYFKTGDLGRSILWYERALRLEPRGDDVRANLGVVRSLIRDQQLVPASKGLRHALLAWHHRLTATESAAIACGFYALFTIVALALIFRRTDFMRAFYRRASWFSPARLFGLTMTQDFVVGMALTAALAIVFAGSAYTKLTAARERGQSVGVSEEVSVYSGPSGDSTVQFKIHEGTIVSVRDGRTGWVRVDLPGDLSGWVEEKTVERI
jgi:tetratricopeptide (TPR) repeat protein